MILTHDKKNIDTYLNYLHKKGFLLLVTKEKPNLNNYNNYNTKFYEFENKFYIIKFDKNTL